MKITLKLLGCTLVGLFLVALSSHHTAAAPTGPLRTSDALADAMSSHGIELDDAGANPSPGGFTPVAYTQTAPQ